MLDKLTRPIRGKIAAACSKGTCPLSHTASFPTPSLQGVSSNPSCSSRGKKAALTGGAIIVASFERQGAHATFKRIRLLPFVAHPPTTLGTLRRFHQLPRLLPFDD